MAIRVVTDSGADIPAELLRAEGIAVVPISVHFGDREYKDGVDLTPAEFYRMLQDGSVMPRTAQPSPADFERVYREVAGPGDVIISCHLSGKLSGTLQSAQIAAQLVEPDVHVVDSRSASMGIGFVALTAARLARQGKDVPAILAELDRLIARQRTFFVVDTLEYLQRNGRIGKAQAMVGSILNVKPLLTLQEGEVAPLERVRGKANAIRRLLDLTVAEAGGQPVRMAILHGNIPDEAEAVRREIAVRLDVRELIVSVLGPTIASHGGPGVIGVTFQPD